MKYDSIIVLSHELTPDWELSEESKIRVEKGTELFKMGYAHYIIMNGGPGKFTAETPYGKFVPRGFHPVQCEAMRDYALYLGIPGKNLLMQNFSSDTIGEAYFVKMMFLAKNGWYNNIIVTSKYHKERASYIYERVLGNKYKIAFAEANPKFNENEIKEIEKKEKEGLERFKRDFGDIESGDSHAFEAALYDRHDIYKKIPESLRPKFCNEFIISPQPKPSRRRG